MALRPSIHELCEALDVARGTFYNYIFRRADHSKREEAQIELTVDLKVSLIGAQKHFQTRLSDFVHPFQNLRIYDLHPVVAFQLYRELKYLADYSRRLYRSL